MHKFQAPVGLLEGSVTMIAVAEEENLFTHFGVAGGTPSFHAFPLAQLHRIRAVFL